MTAETGGKEARKSGRDSLFLLVLLRDADGRELGSGKVRNLSATGMLLETEVPLMEGQALGFELRGIGAVTGRVVRTDQCRFGVHFDKEIDPQLARRTIAKPTAVPSPTHPTRKYRL